MSQTPPNSGPFSDTRPPRVASLLPAATEILCSIGGQALLVARSHECDYPKGLDHLPVLTQDRAFSANPLHTADDVQRLAHDFLAPCVLNTQLLSDLRPDVILTRGSSDSASIDLRTVEQAAAALSPSPAVVALDPSTLEDVLDDYLRIGAAVGLERQAQSAMVELRGRFHRAIDHTNPYADPIPIAFLVWPDLGIAGSWIVQMIERAGGAHPLNPSHANPDAGAAAGPQAAQRLAAPALTVTPVQLVDSAPEFVFLCFNGLNAIERRSAAAALAKQHWWRLLPAVCHHTASNPRVFLIDGNQMFNRPGPRLADAFEWLVSIIQGRPDLKPQGFPAEPYPHA
jgi:iron complex transport system substrate-binding protein